MSARRSKRRRATIRRSLFERRIVRTVAKTWTGLLQHTVLIVTDYQAFQRGSQQFGGTAPSLNRITPVYGVPLAIGIITALGLTTALLGDGLWDWMSWIALALPVAVALVYWHIGARRPEPR